MTRLFLLLVLPILPQLGFVQGVVSEGMNLVVQVRRMGATVCSGVVYRSGLVVTAAHCIEGAFPDTLSVFLRSGAARPASLKAFSDGYDLAFLTVGGLGDFGARVATWHYVGQRVFLVGHPYRIPWIVTSGVLSQVFENEVLETPGPDPSKATRYGSLPRALFAHDANARQGMSGGGLFDEYGRLLGVHVLSLDDGHGFFLGVAVGYPTIEKYFGEVNKK